MMMEAEPDGLSYTSLLQELLLSLIGFNGDVFVQTSEADAEEDAVLSAPPGECRMHLSPDLHWIQEPERQLLNEICRLGSHYQAIQQFISLEGPLSQIQQHAKTTPQRPHSSTAQPAQIQVSSMYRRALVTGLTEIMDVYRVAVLQVQQEILHSNAVPVLASIQYFLTDFTTLLPALHQLVHGLYRTSSRRCSCALIISKLHGLARSGVPILQSCMQRLLWHCNQVFYKQLASWMVHGVLLDPFNEFFISEALNAHCSTRTGSSGRGGGELEVQAYDEWRSGFQVLYNDLPIYVTPELADTIAFVGRAVRMLKTRAAGFSGQDLLPFKDALECAAALQQLQQESVFNKSAFERTVEMIRAKVAGVLWDLLVVQAGLMSQLAAIKDYFLLARGDFYQSFLTDSKRLMALPPRAATVDTDIDGLFQAAGQKSSAATDRLFGLFRMRFTPKGPVVPSMYDVPRFDPNWDPIYLEYKGEWPLGLLITPAHLGKYNALMQFLLRLKRVQLKMDAAWQSLGTKQLRQGLGRSTRARSLGGAQNIAADNTAAGGTNLTSLRQLRYHMAHLVNNLAIYIQTDVIESNYKVLEERIDAAHDFSEAERAHHLYLHNLMDQSFLTSKTICTLISTVFGHVQDLCVVIETADQAQEDGGPGRINYVRVGEIDRAFFRTVGSLYVNLNSQKLQEANRAPHLRQLYMRLDYNHFLIHYTMPKQ